MTSDQPSIGPTSLDGPAARPLPADGSPVEGQPDKENPEVWHSESAVGKNQTSWSAITFILLRVSCDSIAIGAAVAVASLIRFALDWFKFTDVSSTSVFSHAVASASWFITLLALAGTNRLYDEDTLMPGEGETFRLFRTVGEALAVISVIFVFTKWISLSRSWLALLILLTFAFLLVERLIFRHFLSRARTRGNQRMPALLVSKEGGWPRAFVEELIDFKVVGHRTQQSLESSLIDESDQLGQKTALIVRARDYSDDELWRLVVDAGRARRNIYLHSSVRSVGRDRLTMRKMSGHTMVRIAPPKVAGLKAFQKRAFDLVISSFSLLLLLPFLLIVGLAILVASGRPILYKQDRVGYDGRIFRMWKFRSMRKDAEESSGPTWASRDDERVSQIGRLLRKSSVDELPQLWNVIRGEMSLVGPRPERPVFVNLFSRDMTWYRYRHRIKPGLTGWAQAHGLRGQTPLDSRLEFDNWYIEHWNIWIDVYVILRTCRELFGGRNAY